MESLSHDYRSLRNHYISLIAMLVRQMLKVGYKNYKRWGIGRLQGILNE
jgi:hypothetical protein